MNSPQRQLIIKLPAVRHEKFKAAAALRGVTMTSLMRDFVDSIILETVRITWDDIPDDILRPGGCVTWRDLIGWVHYKDLPWPKDREALTALLADHIPALTVTDEA